MGDVNFKFGDIKDSKTFVKAQVEQQGVMKGLHTTQSKSDEPVLAMTTYGISDAMQGMALYKHPAVTYDAFNQELSKELGDMGLEARWELRDNKLTPYDVFVRDPDPSTLGSITLQDGSSSMPPGSSGPAAPSVEGGGAGTSINPNPGPGTEVFTPPPGKSWPAGQLTMEQRADLVLSVGITDPNRAALFVAISQRESSGNSQAHNGNASTGDNSWGLWQFNVIDGAMLPQYLTEWRARDLTDPWTNAKAMYFLSKGGTNLRPWATNPDGTSADGSRPDLDVRKYLPAAIDAVNKVRGGTS
jgi:hypothetical protein